MRKAEADGENFGADAVMSNLRRIIIISHLLDKPADPTILSHRTVEPNLTARKLTSLATHAMPIPDKRGLTHRSRRLRGDIAT